MRGPRSLEWCRRRSEFGGAAVGGCETLECDGREVTAECGTFEGVVEDETVLHVGGCDGCDERSGGFGGGGEDGWCLVCMVVEGEWGP